MIMSVHVQCRYIHVHVCNLLITNWFLILLFSVIKVTLNIQYLLIILFSCVVDNSVCETGDIRLARGLTFTDGRLEVCSNGVWGTVCYAFWDSFDSAVVCSTLGYAKSNGEKRIDALYNQD